MSGPYDAPDKTKPDADKNGPAPRPKDAATLILIRRDGPKPRVLMGQRSVGHDFMPNKYVFPGGKVDAPDGRAPAFSELSQSEAQPLRYQSRRAPRAFALTAVRETFEETGLIIGRSGSHDGYAPPGWAAYLAHDVLPDLSTFTFIGRAVTPPYRHKRFDARFFMADAEAALIDDRPPVEGAELGHLHWVDLDDAQKLDLPSVTRFMLGEIGERLDHPQRALKPPFLRWNRGGHRMDRI